MKRFALIGAVLVAFALTLTTLTGCENPADSGSGTTHYTVSFHANGGAGTAPAALKQEAKEAAITLPGPGDLAKTGSTFGGWNEKNDGNSQNYAPAGMTAEAVYTDGSTAPTP